MSETNEDVGIEAQYSKSTAQLDAEARGANNGLPAPGPAVQDPRYGEADGLGFIGTDQIYRNAADDRQLPHPDPEDWLNNLNPATQGKREDEGDEGEGEGEERKDNEDEGKKDESEGDDKDARDGASKSDDTPNESPSPAATAAPGKKVATKPVKTTAATAPSAPGTK